MKKMRRIKETGFPRIALAILLGLSTPLIAHSTALSSEKSTSPQTPKAALVVSGTVTDVNGNALIGVSIREKGSTNGASTGPDGRYTIRVANENAILEVTYIGFKPKEVPVRGSTILNIILEDAEQLLEEVVVRVGYGTQKKADVTGSVASVNLEAFKEAPNTNIGQYLQGSVPGLNVGVATNAGGTPPISIRGQVTLNGSQNVLIILDGVQYTGSLSSINPDDIASIDVLKDASSTAVYGAQAANGVILITSRKGNSSKPRIAFSSAVTTQSPTVNLRPMTREDFLAGVKDAYWDRSYLAPDYTTPNPDFNVAQVVDASNRDASNNLLSNDYDWWEEGTNRGLIVDNNLSFSGGSERFTYLLSGGMLDQKGTIINDRFRRKTIRANIETKAFSWWKVGLISSGAFVNQDGAEPALSSLQRMSPLLVPFREDGTLIPFPTNTLESNPFTTYYVDDKDRNNYYFANIYTEIDFPFLKGLTYRMNFGNNLRTTERGFSSIYASNMTGEASKANENYYDYTFDNILTYSRQLDKHDLTATLLYGASERKFNSTLARATGFPRLNLSYNNLGLGTNQFSTSAGNEESLAYQMARINYKFDDKYLVTATIRRDGFSGFASNNKYAVFPVLALGWVLSKESFLENVSAVDFLKLRAGYGEIGNQTGRYTSLARVENSAAYLFGDGGTTAFGQQLGSLGNNDLKWERTKGLNIGADFNLLNNRLSGSLEYYNNNTYDLLFDVAIPGITGFGSIRSNLGRIRNKGFEASLTGNIIRKTDFSWSSTFNFSTNNNEIISLTGVDADGDGKEDDLVSSGLFVGKSIRAIFDYQPDGIYQLGETPLPGFFTGSTKLVDQDASGRISPDDRIFLGRREPAYRLSLMNNFSYKRFALSVFFNAVQGGKDGYLGNDNPSFFREDNTIRWNNFEGTDYWSPSNPDGKYPRNISGTRAQVEPNAWRDRSFIRLQDVSLSYSFTTDLLNKIKAQNVSLYVSGKNLATWTDWEGWDPESVDADGNAVGRIIGGRPVMRAFTLGLNITY